MKRLFILFSTLFFFFAYINSVQALAEKSIVPYPGPDQLSGETHNYSLVLKGNGNSVVLGRINFTNTDTSDVTNYEMEFPNSQIENLVVYQEIPKPVCVEYTPSPLSSREPTCARYQPPTYPDPYNSDYKKVEAQVSGSKVSVTLAERVKEASLSGLVLSFNSPKIAEKEWGKYKFSFETPKVASNIQNLQVSVTTDQKSLYLQVDKETVSYESTTELATASLARSDSVGKIAPLIGQGGRAYKYASNLSPGETLKVKGSYSENAFFLNLEKLALFLLVVVGLLILIALIIKINLLGRLGAMLERRVSNPRNLVLTEAVLSFITASVVFGAIFALEYATRTDSFSYLGPLMRDGVFFILIGISVIALVILILGVPALILGLKFGWRHLAYYLMFEFFWLFVLIITYALIFLPFRQVDYPYTIQSDILKTEQRVEPSQTTPANTLQESLD